MNKKLLVLQHVSWENPGKLLVEAAKKQNCSLKVVKVWRQPIPSPTRYDGLLVLGGGPNVDQEEQFPFLVEEKRVVRHHIEEKRPYLGFCLGHQLLAEALGAKIGTNFRPSVGFVSGHQTHHGREHPLFEGIPPKTPLFKWHGQAVKEPLPRHVNILSTSSEVVVEAISLDNHPHIVGVQCDNHAADPIDVQCWLKKDKKWLASLKNFDVNPQEIFDTAEKNRIIIAECVFH